MKHATTLVIALMVSMICAASGANKLLKLAKQNVDQNTVADSDGPDGAGATCAS